MGDKIGADICKKWRKHSSNGPVAILSPSKKLREYWLDCWIAQLNQSFRALHIVLIAWKHFQ